MERLPAGAYISSRKLNAQQFCVCPAPHRAKLGPIIVARASSARPTRMPQGAPTLGVRRHFSRVASLWAMLRERRQASREGQTKSHGGCWYQRCCGSGLNGWSKSGGSEELNYAADTNVIKRTVARRFALDGASFDNASRPGPSPKRPTSHKTWARGRPHCRR